MSKLNPTNANIEEVAAKKALQYVFCDFDLESGKIFTENGENPKDYSDLYCILIGNWESNFYRIDDRDLSKIGKPEYLISVCNDFADCPLETLETFFDIIKDAFSEFKF